MAIKHTKKIAAVATVADTLTEEQKLELTLTAAQQTELSPVQEAIVATPVSQETVDEGLVIESDVMTETLDTVNIDELSLKYDSDEISFEDFEQMVVVNKITAEQFAEITGVEFDLEASKDALVSGPGIGHNNPPADEVKVEDKPKKPAIQEDAIMVERLKQYAPTVAMTSEEARNSVREVLSAILTHIMHGDTSLTSKGAIAIAGYVSFNAGLKEGGSHVFTVDAKMYEKILANIGEMVTDEERKNSTFRTLVSGMIKRAILLMAGEITVGYFIKLPDRKSISPKDLAFAEYPKEIPEGAEVIRSTCIMAGKLAPSVPTRQNGVTLAEHDNSANTKLYLVNNAVVDAKYNALWDRDGKLQYDTITGGIVSFKTGAVVLQEKIEADAIAARKAAELAAGNTPAAKRQTGGTQADPKSLEAAKEQLAEAKKELTETRKLLETSNAKYSPDDVLSVVGLLANFVRDEKTVLPAAVTITVISSVDFMLRKRLADGKHKPTQEEMLAWASLKVAIDARVDHNAKNGEWEWLAPMGGVASSYKLDKLSAK